jgi:hypothetical protein
LNQRLSERRAVLETAFDGESSQLEVLNAKVGMPEEIRLVIRRSQHLVGHRAGVDQLANPAGGSTAHVGEVWAPAKPTSDLSLADPVLRLSEDDERHRRNTRAPNGRV